MTSFNANSSVAALLRVLVDSSVKRAVAKTRVPVSVAGKVEALQDEDLGVAWVRNDGAFMSGDPYQSLNNGWPGVVPTTRIGETFEGDQVRTTFEGAQGPIASRTSALKQIVIPFGAEDGELIRIAEEDGKGYIAFFNGDGDLVGFLDPTSWEIGDLVTPGRRITIDPIGGIRIRSEADNLVAIFDDNGLTLRDPASGLVTAEISQGSFRMVDPNGTDDIEMETSSAGTLPNPSFTQLGQAAPLASITIPATAVFTTTPADDIAIGHVAAYERAVSQAATGTIPASWVEQDDSNAQDASGTLQSYTATLDPATGATVDVTSSQSNWDHAVGTQVVIKGGGAASPAFRSKSTATQTTTAGTVVATIAKPTGAVAGDALLVFVDLGVSGGGVPTGWVTPPGFKQLGAWFSTGGTGATQTTCASGCWIKLLGASEPSDYSTTINLPPGTKIISATAVCIQNPFTVPGGVQIRMAGEPIRRQIAFNELTATGTTLCDFQNIPQSYKHLEVMIDASAGSTGGTSTIIMQFNGDTANNYFNRVTALNGTTTQENLNRLRFGVVGGAGAIGAQTSGSAHIYGYAQPRRRVAMARSYYVTTGPILNDHLMSGQWDNFTDGINRIFIQSAGTVFNVGSRAYLYGY